MNGLGDDVKVVPFPFCPMQEFTCLRIARKENDSAMRTLLLDID